MATKIKKKGGFAAIPHCLAPKCKKPHTGPRFHFLCLKHRDTIGHVTACRLVIEARKARRAK